MVSRTNVCIIGYQPRSLGRRVARGGIFLEMQRSMTAQPTLGNSGEPGQERPSGESLARFLLLLPVLLLACWWTR